MIFKFNIFADNHRFIVEDSENLRSYFDREDVIDDYNHIDMIFYSDGVLIVGTIRNMTVPVTIELSDEKPTEDILSHLFEQANHVTKTGFRAVSGNLVVQNTMGKNYQEINIKKGDYEVIIYYNNIEDIDDMHLVGNDNYHLLFYPGEIMEPVVLKDRLLK